MQGPRQLPRRKRLLFQFIIMALTYGLTELSILVYLNFTFPDLLAKRRSVARLDLTDAVLNNRPMMIHPYIGEVYQPDDPIDPSGEARAQRVTGKLRFNGYGFFDDDTPVRKRAPGKVIVALTGGSVARQLGQTATGVLERELSQISEFQGQQFEFVRLAIDGQKQPQQLMALNYLLTLGGEFDLFINLDGVNEISLPGIDNVPFGVSAAYPRKWNVLTAHTGSIEMMRSVGLVTYLRNVKRHSARWFDTAPWRYSPVATLIWKVRDDRLEKSILEQSNDIDRRSRERLPYCSSGPAEFFDSDEQLLAHCAEIWARSSILLHGLCRASQVRYFHFLQPNQYVRDSKPIGPQEARLALNEASQFARPVRIGYPLLQAKAGQLAEAGVIFTDLTGAFAEHQEPIYKDDCCHVTEAGDEIIATAIAARIKAWYATNDAAGAPQAP